MVEAIKEANGLVSFIRETAGAMPQNLLWLRGGVATETRDVESRVVAEAIEICYISTQKDLPEGRFSVLGESA